MTPVTTGVVQDSGGAQAPPAALDHAGATASLACAIHCALMPFVVTILPFVGLGFLARESTEWLLLACSAVLGVTTLCWGYRSHRSFGAMKFLAIGLTMLVCGRLLEENGREAVGIALVVLGGLGVAGSHFVNKALCRSCRSCHRHPGEQISATSNSTTANH